MKRVLISIVFALFLFSITQSVHAQCKQQLVYQCATKTVNAIYLRDFNTKLKKTKSGGGETGTKWTVVLNKGTRYRFNLCAPDGFQDKVVLTLYDSQNPETTSPYGSTFDAVANKDLEHFDFVCKKSGMYYVSIRFKDGEGEKRTCAVGILSFVGKNK